jgi:hypothetical protein
MARRASAWDARSRKASRFDLNSPPASDPAELIEALNWMLARHDRQTAIRNSAGGDAGDESADRSCRAVLCRRRRVPFARQHRRFLPELGRPASQPRWPPTFGQPAQLLPRCPETASGRQAAIGRRQERTGLQRVTEAVSGLGP